MLSGFDLSRQESHAKFVRKACLRSGGPDRIRLMTDVTTLSMRVAEEIRVLMVRKRVNQKQLAQRLNVSAMWVSGRLTGQTEIAVNDLPRIASALDVPMAQL